MGWQSIERGVMWFGTTLLDMMGEKIQTQPRLSKTRQNNEQLSVCNRKSVQSIVVVEGNFKK